MNARDLLERLAERGIPISVRGDKLHINAAPEAVADLVPELRAAKLELMKLLSDRPTCSGCRHLRMSEIPTPGQVPPYRFVWGCARGHLENGFTLPDLSHLRAPDACLAAGDHQPAFERQHA